jgi:hypothetical protein
MEECTVEAARTAIIYVLNRGLLAQFGVVLVAGFAVFGEGRTTRGARLRRKSMSMM